MKLAAIDIGSNSIHLAIVRATPGQHLEILDREKEMVRLGAGTLTAHRLARDTIDRAVVALRRYKQLAEANHVDRILTTATAAVRESSNSVEFVQRVRKEVGLEVHLLPGIEEARLIALAVSEVTDFNGRRALIMDIGGGSTEFIIKGAGEPELLLSIRLGAVRLSEKFVTTDPISLEERERLVANIRADLARLMWEIKRVGYDFVIGTSGTIVNLVDAALQAERPEEDVSDFEAFSPTASLEQINKLNIRLALMKEEDRQKVPGIEERRADIIIAGGMLLETILVEAGADSITSCDWSLREGVILDYLRKHEAEARFSDWRREADISAADSGSGLHYAEEQGPVEAGQSDVRTKSVLSVARRYDYDEPHSRLVARFCREIFAQTRSLHDMTEQDCKLLEYAALLHDIGYHIAPNNHHRHSLYLIKNSEMPGFTGHETAIIANVARYHRGSRLTGTMDGKARREHEDFKALSKKYRRQVLRLAAILRIADGLDRPHRQTIQGVSCEISEDGVTFNLSARGECDLEVWSAERKADWFQKFFRVPVRFVVQPSASVEEEVSSRVVIAP
jgi:exopolyphosphatase/guanosine-5'-triphosphate,3'-diphosphate pyrophosphatase